MSSWREEGGGLRQHLSVVNSRMRRHNVMSVAGFEPAETTTSAAGDAASTLRGTVVVAGVLMCVDTGPAPHSLVSRRARC